MWSLVSAPFPHLRLQDPELVRSKDSQSMFDGKTEQLIRADMHGIACANML